MMSSICGRPDRHESELSRAVADSDPTRPQGKSPQTDGMWERLHKPGLNEFSRLGFRQKISPSLAELQAELAMWRREYTAERPPRGRWGSGKTPMQTSLAAPPRAKEKL